MYAVIKTGGKQYRVSEGDLLEVEKLPVEVGESLDFNEVLMVSNANDVTVGRPLIEGAKVTATVKGHDRGKKVIIYKHKGNYHKKQGHRQDYTQVKIDKIVSTGGSVGLTKDASVEGEN
jgi:large subunit ribosomal protein L21